MSAFLTIRDESLDRRHAREWILDVITERLSVRELISRRIAQEVDEYNTRRPHTYRGLIRLPPRGRRSRAEGRGERLTHRIDMERQLALACAAFEAGELLILIGDAQADDLDDEFDVRPNTAVTFLSLKTIQGG